MGRFLELTASSEPAPGGGAAAAVTVSLAAGLCTMAARLSKEPLSVAHLAEASELATQSERLRAEVMPLAQADARAYGRVMAAQSARSGVKEALSKAADVPLAIAEVGAEVSGIAARLAEDGNPNLKGDALTATLLAEAGVRAAAALVEINLRAAEIRDGRLDRARRLAESAAKGRS